MKQRIINIADIGLLSRPAAYAAPGAASERFDARSGQIAARLGASKLGYNVTAVPPGRRAFPFHNHRVNEEMFFILAGSGSVRIGAETFPIRSGDVIACPAGGPETAHQIINTGTTELKYLAVSTQEMPEICDYPDSGKFLVTERQRNADGSVSGFRHIGRPESAVDYWDGE
ncbi:MAG TPA: cupin domain-containing protein [Rhodanobacteraceae bacterium]|jgi:uncharacterized cupin superfamily protein|nr:cupin domain-containing protein [Rhodanobacteraceae bacterium]